MSIQSRSISNSKRAICFVAFACLSTACGETASSEVVATPYNPGEATVVGAEKGGEELQLSEACSEYECGTFEDKCGDRAAADVILDKDGNVVDVICYKHEVTVEDVPVDQAESAEAGNNTVLVLDAEDDGADVEGDVTISGNNAVIYGEGPDVSVIGGTVAIEKNNAVVRGVRVKEDVTITKNNTQMAFCVIEGDLTISGNNTTLAECTVYGKVTITGLNTVLVQNQFNQEEISGKNLTCNGNVHFEDADADMSVDPDELGEPIACGDDRPQDDTETDAPEADGGAGLEADAGADKPKK
jgi:hypothetical protein